MSIYIAYCFVEEEIHSHKNGNETTFYWTHMWFSYLKCYIMLKGGSAIVNNIRSSQLDSIKGIKAKPQPKQCFFKLNQILKHEKNSFQLVHDTGKVF